MRIAGRLAGEVIQMIRPHVKAVITTNELDKICHDYIVEVQKAIPATLNYHGFPNPYAPPSIIRSATVYRVLLN